MRNGLILIMLVNANRKLIHQIKQVPKAFCKFVPMVKANRLKMRVRVGLEDNSLFQFQWRNGKI